jgi:hypothetical protein
MPSDDFTWTPSTPSTKNRQALARYRQGVVALVAGTGRAQQLFADALEADPDLYVAKVAVALCDVLTGLPYATPQPTSPLTRWERQHGEIVQAALTGQTIRAHDLRREHLLEHPDDVLIAWLPATL